MAKEKKKHGFNIARGLWGCVDQQVRKYKCKRKKPKKGRDLWFGCVVAPVSLQ